MWWTMLEVIRAGWMTASLPHPILYYAAHHNIAYPDSHDDDGIESHLSYLLKSL